MYTSTALTIIYKIIILHFVYRSDFHSTVFISNGSGTISNKRKKKVFGLDSGYQGYKLSDVHLEF